MRSNPISGAGQLPGVVERMLEDPEQATLRSFFEAIAATCFAIAAAKNSPDTPTQ